MIFKVWIPDRDETSESPREHEATDPRMAAQRAAMHDHSTRDGWEWTWPITYHVRGETGPTWSVEVNRETVPEFRAEQPKRVP